MLGSYKAIPLGKLIKHMFLTIDKKGVANDEIYEKDHPCEHKNEPWKGLKRVLLSK